MYVPWTLLSPLGYIATEGNDKFRVISHLRAA